MCFEFPFGSIEKFYTMACGLLTKFGSCVFFFCSTRSCFRQVLSVASADYVCNRKNAVIYVRECPSVNTGLVVPFHAAQASNVLGKVQNPTSSLIEFATKDSNCTNIRVSS